MSNGMFYYLVDLMQFLSLVASPCVFLCVCFFFLCFLLFAYLKGDISPCNYQLYAHFVEAGHIPCKDNSLFLLITVQLTAMISILCEIGVVLVFV